MTIDDWIKDVGVHYSPAAAQILDAEIKKLRAALEAAPAPLNIDPETQQPLVRLQMYENPVPRDRYYADWYNGPRKQALEGGDVEQESLTASLARHHKDV